MAACRCRRVLPGRCRCARPRAAHCAPLRRRAVFPPRKRPRPHHRGSLPAASRGWISQRHDRRAAASTGELRGVPRLPVRRPTLLIGRSGRPDLGRSGGAWHPRQIRRAARVRGIAFLIVYDAPPSTEFEKLAFGCAIMLKNLIAHFDTDAELMPFHEYVAGKMNDYDAAFYLGA